MSGINWRAWDNAAFSEAHDSGKPVLLAISAVWCHWCHVMDRTTYSDPSVINAINSGFVPVRVDSDRNPDLNTRYNMGGWPTLAFLTPLRDIITGATYVPPDHMLRILDSVSEAYAMDRDAIIEQARNNRLENEKRFAPRQAGSGTFCDCDRIFARIASAFDPVHAGFGRQPKFPHIEALEALVFRYDRSGNRDDLEMLTRTLKAMIAGEMFDRTEGGMFRYAVARDWTELHYEKMLSDNAGISRVLLDAFRITGDSIFVDTANRVFEYLESTLLEPATGAFFGSQDADEEYYRAEGEARRGLPAPSVDSAVYVDSNAQTVRAYLKLWEITGSPEARQKALEVMRFLLALPRAEDGSVAHYFEDGSARGYGNLADPAAMVEAALECFDASADPSFLDSAVELADMVLNVFRSPEGACYDISANRARERGISRYAAPLAENAEFAGCLTRLAGLTGLRSYLDQATEILDSTAVYCEAYGLMAAPYAVAALRLFS